MPMQQTPENYLKDLLAHIEVEYIVLAQKYHGLHNSNPESRLDEMCAYVLGGKYAQAKGLDLSTVLAQQTQAQAAILNFANLRPVLSACIQTYLYKLSAENVLSTSHGVVQGILEATKPYIQQITNLSYVECKDYAKALYNKILAHTNGFATALPLPEITPLTADDIASIQARAVLPFDLTAPLAQAIKGLKADVVTAFAEVLSVSPDLSTLTQVNDNAIKKAAYLLIGRASDPYLLDGELVIHDVTSDKFYRVIPTIGVDNYAAYGFRSYNYRNLHERIYQQQRILGISSDDDGYIEYEELPMGKPEARRKLIERLASQDKEFTNLLTPAFADTEFIEESSRVKAAYFKTVKYISYYSPVIFISAHKLAAYTYYPQEYSDLIIRKPLDPETGEPAIYHLHHKDGCRSNNTPENIEIISHQENMEVRSTSRPVIYRGTRYNTLKAYCEATNAGAYDKLTSRLASLSSTAPVTYNGRIYTIDAARIIVVTDDIQTMTIKDFAVTNGFSPDALRQVVSRARRQGKTAITYKGVDIILSDDGTIKINT